MVGGNEEGIRIVRILSHMGGTGEEYVQTEDGHIWRRDDLYGVEAGTCTRLHGVRVDDRIFPR